MSAIDTTTATPQLLLAGKALDERLADKLVSLEVVLSVHTSGVATVAFDDHWLQLFDAGGIDVGQPFAIKLPDASGKKYVEVFAGRVTRIGIEHELQPGEPPRARYVVEARDESHRLARAAKFEAHEKTAADVVKAIAKRHKLTPEIGTLPDVGGEKYIIQAGTDHALLTQLARRYGCEWFTDGETLHFRPRPKLEDGVAISRLERSLRHFSATYSGVGLPASIDVFGWDPSAAKLTQAKKADVKPTATDLGSDAPFVDQQAKLGQKAFGQALVVGELGATTAKENQSIAESLAREAVGAGLTAQGEADCNPGIRAGGYLKVDGFGKRLSGNYYVTEVRHIFGPEQELATRFTCSGHAVEPPPWEPAGVGAGGGWAASGPVVGVVTNINDKEKLGRVKVRFPSLGEVESTWARVVSVGAGPERGLDVRPEPNDEVLVVFERGDARFPVVIGGLWNGKSKPPPEAKTEGDEASSVATSRVMRSRSGHVLAFGDGPANEAAGSAKRYVSVTTGDGKSHVTINEKDGITLEVPDGNEITLKAGAASLTLNKSGDIVVKTAKGKFIVDASQVKVEGKTKLEVKGAAGALLDGGPKLDVKSSGVATVQAGGMLTLKGSMVKIN